MATRSIPPRTELDEQSLQEITNACNLSPSQIEDVYSCTPLQTATIVESALHKGASVFQFVLNLAESIDVDRFSSALSKVVSLNTILRTRFVESSRYGFVSVVTDADITHETQLLPVDSGDVEAFLPADKAKPLNLGLPLFRSTIIGHKLVVTVHHGIMDHASLTPLFEDVLSIYHCRKPGNRADFKEFAAHCVEISDSMAREFWEPRFRGVPSVYPKVESGYVPLATRIMTRKIVFKQFDREFSQAHIPSYIEAAWALSASVYTGSESVAYGLVLSGRTSVSPAAETTLGPTIAVLPAQIDLKHSTTLEVMLKDSATARRQLQTHPALQYGLTRIRNVSDAARMASNFQTLLNIRPRWYDAREDAEISFDHMHEPHGAFALALSCDLEDASISVRAVFDPAILDEQQLSRVLNQFEHYLQALVAAPRSIKVNQIPRLNPHDLNELIEMNDEAHIRTTHEKSIPDLFSAKVHENPIAIAIVAHDGEMSYGELNETSDRLAHELRRKGVSTEMPVAFVFDKTKWTVVAILGILKAGGTCLPLATSDPEDRRASLVSKAAVQIALVSKSQIETCRGLAREVLEVSADTIPQLPAVDTGLGWKVSPESLAYILFTSGSTGLPKGVMLEHRNLISSLQCFIPLFNWNEETRMLQFASNIWDISICEVLGALLSGGRLCIPSNEDRESALAHFIQSQKINCALLTPTVLRAMSPEEVPGLELLVSVGEAVPPEAARTWGQGRRFFNGWGPCETSICSAVGKLGPDSPYPETIGNAVNCSIWIVNPRNINELTPIGAVGEMIIEGPGVARGYLKDDAKTKMSFVKPPTWAPPREKSSWRFYRSGDLAKYYPDGSLCFVGRQDSQVKIRGQRLELGEVEGAIATCDEVRDIFVTTKISEGRTELVAVVCLSDQSVPRGNILQELGGDYADYGTHKLRLIRSYTLAKLPLYMVPTVWLVVEMLPTTPSAKIDRVSTTQWLKSKSLSSARAALESALDSALSPPVTPEEMSLQSIWSLVLKIPEGEIGRESLFAQLGGDSILAMQVSSLARKQGLRIPSVALLLSTSNSLSSIAANSKKVKEVSDDHSSGIDVLLPDNEDTGRKKSMLRNLERLAEPLKRQNIEALAPTTHGQAVMIAVGETRGRGYHIDFDLEFVPALDTGRLQEACTLVIRNHPILRTAFAWEGSNLCQVVLNTIPSNMVIVEKTEQCSSRLLYQQGMVLACFHLFSSGQNDCHRMTLEIHHALYDAISLGLIFRDLDAAYKSQPLCDGLDFHAWISRTIQLDNAAPLKFWSEVLEGSSMPYLVPPVPGGTRGHPLQEQSHIRVPMQSLKTALGTISSVVKTAWSLLLSFALDSSDVVFGEVSANRFLPLPGVEEVKGPCVNLVPVRARIGPHVTLGSLVTQIHNLSLTGMPFHHVETGTIIAECTSWPKWTRFSTALVYQNHDAIHEVLRIGDADATISHHGRLGDSTDLHLIAIPGPDVLGIELRYSTLTVPPEQIKWIAQTLTRILESFAGGLDKSVENIRANVCGANGAYKMPSTPVTPRKQHICSGDASQTSAKALRIVAKAWEDAGLTCETSHSDPNINQDPGSDRNSMWDCGATMLTALLLSDTYRAGGLGITVEDIVENPSRWAQACLVETQESRPDHGDP